MRDGTLQLGTGITFYYVMNKGQMGGPVPDHKKIFTDVASAAREKQALLWDQMDIEGMDLFKSGADRSSVFLRPRLRNG